MTESTQRHIMNPAVVKGSAFTVAGLVILAAPHAAELMLQIPCRGLPPGRELRAISGVTAVVATERTASSGRFWGSPAESPC